MLGVQEDIVVPERRLARFRPRVPHRGFRVVAVLYPCDFLLCGGRIDRVAANGVGWQSRTSGLALQYS
jgi:hypothetical protein